MSAISNPRDADTVGAKTGGTLADPVYGALAKMIASGEYVGDSRLPGELHLSKEFGVSRPVLRHALARLRTEGLIYSRQGAGNFVCKRASEGALDFGPLQSLPDVHRCLTFRLALESEAAALAAANRDPESLENIARAIRAIDRAIASDNPAVDEDLALHIEVARASRNRFFVVTLDALRPQIRFGINLIRGLTARPQERLGQVQAEHAAIYEAIRKHEPDEARRAMADHLGNGVLRLFEKEG
ncbi:MAG: FCD domain-containing protein [Devosia sp.]|nr:FCD domain-containing protein [Devosia sp.]